MPKKISIPNNYRIGKIKNGYLVTTDHGSWVFLKQKDYDLLRLGNYRKSKRLFNLLEKEGIILTRNNVENVIKCQREKYKFLSQGPSLHIIIPTLRCNMKCLYCHASSKNIHSKGFDMDKKTAKSVIDFIFKSPSKSICIEFQGGEPLLNFEVVKFIIEYSKKLNDFAKKDLAMSIVTNLSLIDDKKLDYLIKNDVSICTSLDGPKILHDKNRRLLSKESNYDQVTTWIKKIRNGYKKRGIKNKRADALVTITRYSLSRPKELIDEYVKQGIKEIHLRFLNNLGDARPLWGRISYSPSEFIEFWKKSMDYMINLNKKGKYVRERFTNIVLQKLIEKIEPNYLDLMSPCGAAIGQLAYNYDGTVYTCDEGRMIGEDIFSLGNVKKDSYKKILTSPATCAIIAASCNDTQICDTCVYKPYCGICPVCNYAEQGSIIAKITETNRCKIFKAQFEYIFDKLKNKEIKKIFMKWLKDKARQ